MYKVINNKQTSAHISQKRNNSIITLYALSRVMRPHEVFIIRCF